MTITLDDVDTLIGIPVVGRSVNPSTVDDLMILVMRILGVTRRAAMDELEQVRGTSVRLEWLRANFSCVADADTEAQIQSTARAYLLYLVGAPYSVIRVEQEFPPCTLSCLRTWVMFIDLHGA